MTITIKKGSSIILEDKSKIVEGGEIKGGFLQFLIPILAAAAGPVLANILNKVVDKKTLSQKDKDIIEKNIRTLMNITNKEDSDCEDDIPLLCFDKSKQIENINPTDEIKKLLNIQDPRLFETKS
ncbi:hypothetical protein QE152_g15866 [Popillia japonica]|uniref:Uncharacterized protein n=1 Tax=Popillia japonica TaxID=7064 RepID=A0AAW1L6J4_POPJA